MPKYLFSYHQGEFPSDMTDTVGAAWTKWLDGLGDRVVDRGGPLDPAKLVGAGGTVTDAGSSETTGYSIIAADSIESALAIAADCPQIRPPHRQGSVEVAELIDL